MKEAEKYIFGQPRVPPWVGDVLKDIQYDEAGNLSRATVSKVKLKKGDVLMKVGKAVFVLPRNEAVKYGVMK